MTSTPEHILATFLPLIIVRKFSAQTHLTPLSGVPACLFAAKELKESTLFWVDGVGLLSGMMHI